MFTQISVWKLLYSNYMLDTPRHYHGREVRSGSFPNILSTISDCKRALARNQRNLNAANRSTAISH